VPAKVRAFLDALEAEAAAPSLSSRP
jgi:hypothetical protein